MLTAPINHVSLDDRGVARITGTSIKITDIVIDTVTWGMSPRQIQENYPALSLAEIHAALVHYYDNKQDLDAQIALADEDFAKTRAEFPNTFTRDQLLERRKHRDRGEQPA